MERPPVPGRYCCGAGLLGGAVFYPASLDTVELAIPHSPHLFIAGIGVPGS